LIKSGLPELDNVLMVEGLNVNLISISQLCDQDLRVNFTKSECLVTNGDNEVVMRGVRSRLNCYVWIPPEGEHSSTLLEMDNLEHKQLKKAMSKDICEKLSNLEIEESSVGKRSKLTRQELQHLTPSIFQVSSYKDLMVPLNMEFTPMNEQEIRQDPFASLL
jgi:hypothetical protein